MAKKKAALINYHNTNSWKIDLSCNGTNNIETQIRLDLIRVLMVSGLSQVTASQNRPYSPTTLNLIRDADQRSKSVFTNPDQSSLN